MDLRESDSDALFLDEAKHRLPGGIEVKRLK